MTGTTPENKNLPAWLATNIERRAQVDAPIRGTNRSETVDELHARILREKGERWDAKAQKWVKALTARERG